MRLKENSDKYLILEPEVNMDFPSFRFCNGVVTSAPEGQDDAAQSSQYFVGDIIYSEEDRGVALVKDDNNGWLHIMNVNEQSCKTLVLEEDTPFEAVAEFVHLCWGEFMNIDSNTVFDAYLEEFSM